MNYRISTAIATSVLLSSAVYSVAASAQSLPLEFKFKSADERLPIKHRKFTAWDLITRAPRTTFGVELPDGRIVAADSYLRELNSIERELNSYGHTLRSNQTDLGLVAVSAAAEPRFYSQKANTPNSQNNSTWHHILNHEYATISSSGSVIHQSRSEESDSFERMTTHTVAGRLFKSPTGQIAQVTQRVVKSAQGEERKESAVFINGVQVFRSGRTDHQEARVWETAFDVPLREVTVPIGPGSIEAKLGIRGRVILDMGLGADRSPSRLVPDIALNFKPQVIADGYVSAATTPTNVGDAGIEGALQLCKNTLDINGTAQLNRKFKIDLKKLTVDNTFEGFTGKIYGYTNVKLPGSKNDDSSHRRFEKEFYSWGGVKFEQRLYEYEAEAPNPEIVESFQ